ncbi:protein SINE1 [Malania oleifera]|uniref:protein SINE1 n=1 Tax=Malania oleifera TaxID=397392 RepID=UPI0025ADE2BA|nr:protein SINE1 [Malania oleifera]XP_057982891.1 protein SINE1 [Malania oleifera]XP_057982893.1 protein SINE1 [Malania oleifera]
MVRNLSPIVRRELANLDKDADSRKLAMKALKSYVKDLDSKAIPHFLAQVSETKETGSSSGEYTISLFEVLARVHGVNIVPQIDNIMATIIKTLKSSAGSFALHQACSKVVPAIARYGINPTTPEDKKRHIIHSLCKPLSDSLMGSQESLSSGAALCLKALVDSDNWRFASDEMVNEVCLRVAGTLEDKPTHINSHMGLVMALAKHNGFIVEAYARLLIQSGLRILNVGIAEGNSQKRLSAIQTVNFLMKCLDPRSIFSELALIIEEMENCQSDQMAYVRGAAFEALQTARKIAVEKGSKFDKDLASITGSNTSRRENSRRKNLFSAGQQSPVFASPESQTLDSFVGYDSFLDSPISMRQVSSNLGYDCRSVNRKLWRYENGGVDVSLKDGLFSEIVSGSPTSNTFSDHSGLDELVGDSRDCTDGFAGFQQESSRNGEVRSTTPSPQRSRSQINVDNIKIFTTPRKLIRSLQDPIDINSDFSEKQTSRFQDPSSSRYEWTPTAKCDQHGFSHGVNYEVKGNEKSPGSVGQFKDGSESVSSTDDVPHDADPQVSCEIDPETVTGAQKLSTERTKRKKTTFNLICGLIFLLIAIFASLLLMDHQDGSFYLVPT